MWSVINVQFSWKFLHACSHSKIATRASCCTDLQTYPAANSTSLAFQQNPFPAVACPTARNLSLVYRWVNTTAFLGQWQGGGAWAICHAVDAHACMPSHQASRHAAWPVAAEWKGQV